MERILIGVTRRDKVTNQNLRMKTNVRDIIRDVMSKSIDVCLCLTQPFKLSRGSLCYDPMHDGIARFPVDKHGCAHERDFDNVFTELYERNLQEVE